MKFMERENMRERAKAALRAVLAHVEESTIVALAEWLLHEGALFPPVKMGQTVYSAGDGVPGEVQGIAYDRGEWHAIDPEGYQERVGSDDCLLTRQDAERVMKEESVKNGEV